MIDIDQLESSIVIKKLKQGDDFTFKSLSELFSYLPYYIERGPLKLDDAYQFSIGSGFIIKLSCESDFKLYYICDSIERRCYFGVNGLLSFPLDTKDNKELHEYFVQKSANKD